MKLLLDSINYNDELELAKQIQINNENYTGDVTFHCFWHGILSEKHLISIRSCYCFNVHNKKNRKIILWVEQNKVNEINEEIKKFAEIREFDYKKEISTTIFNDKKFDFKTKLSYYADLVRYILLLKYGGIWFDLDILFFRNIDPILINYSNSICVYRWEKENYPNNAFYISLNKNNPDMINNINFLINRNLGWGFQAHATEDNLTYDTNMSLLVLPCSWFDPSWIDNPYSFKHDQFFKPTSKIWTFDTFFPGAFCFHWHNQWDEDIAKTSVCRQLDNIIINKFSELWEVN